MCEIKSICSDVHLIRHVKNITLNWRRTIFTAHNIFTVSSVIAVIPIVGGEGGGRGRKSLDV